VAVASSDEVFSLRQVTRNCHERIVIVSHQSLVVKGASFMNKDQVAGKAEQVAGRVKQGVGETFGNQKLANEGVADQVKGAAKETWGNAKDAAQATADRHKQEAEHKANDARAGVLDKVNAAHDSVNEKLDAHTIREREKAKTA
jgi:uncharacterized protein YjbJ (UPF0337 family)